MCMTVQISSLVTGAVNLKQYENSNQSEWTAILFDLL